MERNIYQVARETAGYTQDKAAELLDLSVESVRAYENDKTLPNPNTVLKMVYIYGVHHLSYQHLEKMDKFDALPTLNIRSIEGASLGYKKQSSDVDKMWGEYLDIIHDGIITEDEIPVARRFLREIEEELAAAITVKYAIEDAINKTERKE